MRSGVSLKFASTIRARGDFIELFKHVRGFSPAIMVQDSFHVTDHAKGMIELIHASFHIPGLERCKCAQEVPQNGVVEQDDLTNG